MSIFEEFNSNVLLREVQVARRLGISERTLQGYRYRDKGLPVEAMRGPPWIAVGGAIRYRIEDVLAFETRGQKRTGAVEMTPRPSWKASRQTGGMAQKANNNKFRLADWAEKQRTGSEGADNLLGKLGRLCNSTGVCTMSDQGLAERFGFSKRSVTRRLAYLRGAKFIAVHFEKGKRKITFKLPTDSQSGGEPAPDWRTGPRQIGGQNPVKGIHSPALRAEYAQAAGIADIETKIRVLADIKRRDEDNRRIA